MRDQKNDKYGKTASSNKGTMRRTVVQFYEKIETVWKFGKNESGRKYDDHT